MGVVVCKSTGAHGQDPVPDRGGVPHPLRPVHTSPGDLEPLCDLTLVYMDRMVFCRDVGWKRGTWHCVQPMGCHQETLARNTWRFYNPPVACVGVQGTSNPSATCPLQCSGRTARHMALTPWVRLVGRVARMGLDPLPLLVNPCLARRRLPVI